MAGQKLLDIFLTRRRTSIKFLSYFRSYERIMSAAAHPENPVVVEIGVLGGGSLEMWQEYFGSSAKIIGVDLNPHVKTEVGSDFDVFLADQHDLAAMVSVFKEIGPIDYLIDDGAHTNLSVFHTLCLAQAFVKPGGVLVVEDLHTSFERSFGNPHKTSVFSIFSDLAESMAGGSSPSSKGYGSSFWEPLVARIASIEVYPRMMAIRFSDDGSMADDDRLLENHRSRTSASDLFDQRSVTDQPFFMRWQNFDQLRHYLRWILPILRPTLRNYQSFRLWTRYRQMNRQITRTINGTRAPGKNLSEMMSLMVSSGGLQHGQQRDL